MENTLAELGTTQIAKPTALRLNDKPRRGLSVVGDDEQAGTVFRCADQGLDIP
ncbi:hypothetical protein [Streptomyces sp. NPDC093094]|uniref:hypothetical protein n=1 Tax=Streptomyces sp. NPDC093094 TaxID=3366026 RepID=UPI003807D575